MEALYSSLASAHHIRVLRLEKSISGEVNASLEQVDLLTEPEYCCLSYTWGGPRWENEDEEWNIPNQPVLVNDYRLEIGPNLRNALDHLHGVLAGRAIWIDAICINQGDILERSAQVALMKNIYEQAQDVVIWLGEASPVWERAIKNMDRFTLTLEGYWKGFSQAVDLWKDAFIACEFTNEEHVDIIHFVTGNKWFSRIWTLQEHILAREVRFLCGDVLITLETMWKGSMIATMAGVTTVWVDLDVRRERWTKEFSETVVVRHRYPYNEHTQESLGTNAHKYRYRESTDPKDKIFGVLGISRTTDKWIKKPFVVDYSLSVQEIYTQAAAFGLVAWKGLEALSHVGDRTENQIPNLPSWVPDFTQVLPWKPFGVTGENEKFKAASTLQAELWLDCVKEKVVVFTASPIDSIVSTCDAHWGERDHGGMSEFMKLLFQPSAPTTMYNEDVASVILRLVVADGFKNDGVDPRENLTILFEQWLFSGLFYCNEAHRGEVDSAIAFWRDPESQISSMAEALDISCSFLEQLLEPICRGAKQCKTVEDIELSLKGRRQTNDAYARYMSSTRHELSLQWEHAGSNRRFFRTSRGYVGIGPRSIEVGDRVMLLHGAYVPFVFRHLPKDAETVLDFVGEAYLHGLMYGEALEQDSLKWGKISVYLQAFVKLVHSPNR